MFENIIIFDSDLTNNLKIVKFKDNYYFVNKLISIVRIYYVISCKSQYVIDLLFNNKCFGDIISNETIYLYNESVWEVLPSYFSLSKAVLYEHVQLEMKELQFKFENLSHDQQTTLCNLFPDIKTLALFI
jgi:hypothetical protein